MNIHSPAERPSSLIDTLLAVWEASVRATHHFLSEQDIQSIKPLVAVGLCEIPSLHILVADHNEPVGFMGVDDAKIEMLFISPEARGNGLGRCMIDYAVNTLGAKSVDVNEQNTQGVGFYIHVGFEVASRSEKDGQGNPFPILHLTLRQEEAGIPEGYEIRHAEPVHIPFLNDIELAAATIFPAGSIPDHILTERVPASVLTEAMKKARLWIALDRNDRPVGYALLQIREGSALLAQIDVLPEHGQKGLGTALVRRVVKAVQGMGLPALYLTTFSHVPWNAPFYAKRGFTTLSSEDQPDWLRSILTEERACGLEKRVAMKVKVAL